MAAAASSDLNQFIVSFPSFAESLRGIRAERPDCPESSPAPDVNKAGRDRNAVRMKNFIS
ncbi:hypothetical protein MesoLjLc_32640 [Mesorhizobium sp. L-8-10]|nr:hypothetical protein MesoLjLb_33910 [Mesorhizobium sp. L-8-3]BCH31334.1 hypothetical protein MesoLjLc_32640 [Mesorhizobium sp. L-8-10]